MWIVQSGSRWIAPVAIVKKPPCSKQSTQQIFKLNPILTALELLRALRHQRPAVHQSGLGMLIPSSCPACPCSYRVSGPLPSCSGLYNHSMFLAFWSSSPVKSMAHRSVGCRGCEIQNPTIVAKGKKSISPKHHLLQLRHVP